MTTEDVAKKGKIKGEAGGGVEGEARLKELGYKQELSRGLDIIGNVSIAVSDLSPTTGLFMQLAVVIAMAGTGAWYAYWIGGLIAISVALTMGELGSRYPVAGGLYSIVLRVMGRPMGFLAFVDYLVQAVFVPGTVGLAAAQYIAAILGVNIYIMAPIVMALATLIAILRINQGAKVVGFFLVLELLVTLVFGVVALTRPVQPISILFAPVHLPAGATAATPVNLGLIFAAITVALFAFNGYDSAINFSEETEGAAKNVGKSVFNAAAIGILFQIIPLTFILLAVPDLIQMMSSSAPITYIGESLLGNFAGTFLTLGAAIAMFNCTIACIIQFARVLYSSGRDKAWPEFINKAFSTVSPRFQTPWIATIVVGAVSGSLVFMGSLLSLVTFGAVMIVVLYVVIAICDLMERARGRKFPFSMPLWPIPPAIAILGGLAALSQQKLTDIGIVAGIFALGLLYYFLYLRPREGKRWTVN